MSLRPKLDIPPFELQAAIEEYGRRGCLIRCGSAGMVFLRPTDDQLEFLKNGGEPDGDKEDFFGGRNIYSMYWWGDGVRDQLALTRAVAGAVPEGGRFAWHALEGYREVDPERRRRSKCQQQR